MEVCIRRAKPGDEETLAMIQIKSWQSAFADILDRETLEGCTAFERVTATYRRLLEQGIGNGYLLIELLPSLDHRIGKICICPCQRHLPALIRMHTARPACRRTELCLVLVNINYCHILLLSYIRKKHPRLSLRCFLRC